MLRRGYGAGAIGRGSKLWSTVSASGFPKPPSQQRALQRRIINSATICRHRQRQMTPRDIGTSVGGFKTLRGGQLGRAVTNGSGDQESESPTDDR